MSIRRLAVFSSELPLIESPRVTATSTSTLTQTALYVKKLFEKVQLFISSQMLISKGQVIFEIEGDINDKTWNVCMNRLGLSVKDDHWEISDSPGIGIFREDTTVVIRPV